MNTTSYQQIGAKSVDRVHHTIWGVRLATMAQLGIPLSHMPHTTLNERLGIYESGRFTDKDKLRTFWYCIGNNGVNIVAGPEEIYTNEPVDYDPRTPVAYNPMPFVLRRLNDDLTDTERENYRLRRKENHNGVDYWAYYAKKFDIEKVVRVLIERTENGTTVPSEYTTTSDLLYPKKPVVSPRRVEKTSNEKIFVSCPASIIFTEQDVQEFYEVCRIKYNSTAPAIVSEIGLIMGVDERYRSPVDGIQYQELKCATVATLLNSLHDLNYNPDGFVEQLSVGDKAPLLTMSTLTPTIGG